MDRGYFRKALESLDPTVLLSMYDFSSADILDVDHSVHKHISRMVVEVDNAYRLTFPNLTKDQIRPEAFVTWGNSFGIYTGPSPEDNTPQNNLILFILPKPLYLKIGPEELKGMIAHELSHMYLRHGAHENPRRDQDVYLRKNDILGPPQVFNRELNRKVKKWVALSEVPESDRTDEIKSEISNIEKLVDISLLSRYSTEVEADEYGTLVSLSMKVNPLAWLSFSMSITRGNSEAISGNPCLKLIESGETPLYGSLKENHPSHCWRYNYVRNITKISDLALNH